MESNPNPKSDVITEKKSNMERHREGEYEQERVKNGQRENMKM
jgi:hypothetical protein